MTDALLPLPISPERLQGLISQAYDLLPAKMASDEGRVMLTAIGLQESNLAARRQYGNGPAKGLCQFEKGGGVRGVMTHDAVDHITKQVCDARGVPFTAEDIWDALEFDDVLALALARLLLYTDPKPLPVLTVGAADAAWAYYLRNWRPGKPHPDKWPSNWVKALNAVATRSDDLAEDVA